MINLLFFLFTSIHAINVPPRVELSILVNNRPFDSENESVAKTDTIYLKLKNLQIGTKYKFESVKIKCLVKESSTAPERAAVMTPKGTIYLPGANSTWTNISDFGFYPPNNYQSKPILKIPYNIFYDDCLSRVLIKVDKISYQRGTRKGNLSSSEFDYTKEYEFWPDWDCH